MDAAARHPQATARIVPVPGRHDVEAVLVSILSRRCPFVLESADRTSPYSRFTIVGFDPVHILTVRGDEPAPLERLANEVAAYPAAAGLPQVPFAGGWVGFISYEAGLWTEAIRPTTAADIRLPALRFALYDAAAVLDHATGQWYAVAIDWPDDARIGRPPVEHRLSEVADLIAESTPPANLEWNEPVCPAPKAGWSREDHLNAVARAKHYIEAGDVYQVNLAQRFSTTTTAQPVELYRRLRRANPSPYAALLQWDDQAVISSSPELFLDLRGRRVITRPIKGTRPRTGDEALDALRRRELLASAKDRAELTMIVDLLRNDLGRVCEYGSVRVIDAAELESHPTVYHLVGTIEGRLRSECEWADLLRASFPGGSITGAPKVRAMQIIDELERTCRSAFCGSIGYIGLDGSMCLNIAIRTMVKDGQDLHLFAGGGIVADSDPQEEYDETLAKAAGMLRALGHALPAATPESMAELTS